MAVADAAGQSLGFVPVFQVRGVEVDRLVGIHREGDGAEARAGVVDAEDADGAGPVGAVDDAEEAGGGGACGQDQREGVGVLRECCGCGSQEAGEGQRLGGGEAVSSGGARLGWPRRARNG